jgi:hypothetical protein
MVLCARGSHFCGPGSYRFDWKSSDPRVATVRDAGLPVTHCLDELANAEVQAIGPGSTTISVALVRDGVPLWTMSEPLTVGR